MSNLLAGDCRRASALAVHYGAQSPQGVDQILRESVEVGRVTPTIEAALSLFQIAVPEFMTGLGLAALSEVILGMAQDSESDPDLRRAAGIIAHHGNNNADGFNSVLVEAKNTDRVTELILAVLHLYMTVAPVLFTPLGLRALEENVMRLAVEEAGE